MKSEKTITASWYDRRFRGLLWQVLVVAIVVAAIAWLWRNAAHNLDARRISTGFGFLSREAGMPIADTLIAYSPSDTYVRALIVGVLNTIRVAAIGVVLATIIGTLIGIARLSKNWMLARLCAIYVEVLRDLPLLLQIFVWYVLLQGLPPARQALQPLPGLFLTNRGLFIPTIHWEAAHGLVLLALCAGVAGAVAYRRRAIAAQMLDGRPRRIWPVALTLIIGVPALASFGSGAVWSVSAPELRGFNFVGGASRGAWPLARRDHQTDRAAADHALHHPSADESVPESDQELVARGRYRLSRHRLDCEYDAQSDRAGD